MSWRFRKIYRTGPFRWTWSKRGIGWNWKLPGFRFGISPTGQKYISFGIPGTGFYYIKYFKGGFSVPTFIKSIISGLRNLFPNSIGSLLLMVIACVVLASFYQEIRKSFVIETPPAVSPVSHKQTKPSVQKESNSTAVIENKSKKAEEVTKEPEPEVTKKEVVKEETTKSAPTEQPKIVRDYFTIGSTSDEVLSIQGTPTTMYGNTYSYGFSSVTFYQGKLVSYYNSGNLRIKVFPSTQVYSNYFTLGSSIDEVLSIQGTPSSIYGNTFSYGFSSITFYQGNVSNYYNSGNLRIKIFPSTAVTSKMNYFTLGSSVDEVLSIQGTPSSIYGNTLSYGFSSVTFYNGKVTNYYNAGNLKIRINPQGQQ